MTLEYCETKGAMCDPTDCPQEFCKWRDNDRVRRTLDNWSTEGDTSWLYKLAGKNNDKKSIKKVENE